MQNFKALAIVGLYIFYAGVTAFAEDSYSSSKIEASENVRFVKPSTKIIVKLQDNTKLAAEIEKVISAPYSDITLAPNQTSIRFKIKNEKRDLILTASVDGENDVDLKCLMDALKEGIVEELVFREPLFFPVLVNSWTAFIATEKTKGLTVFISSQAFMNLKLKNYPEIVADGTVGLEICNAIAKYKKHQSL